MVDMKRALLAVTLAVTFAFAGSALAQGKKDQAPGQQVTILVKPSRPDVQTSCRLDHSSN